MSSPRSIDFRSSRSMAARFSFRMSRMFTMAIRYRPIPSRSTEHLCLPQIKPEHIGDAVHPGPDGTECVPLPRRHVISARPCSTISECACHYTTRRRNAHGIAEYELLYPWHPWAGCLVHIHEAVEKAGREVFRCSLSGRASGRWLEIPAWMF